ncbi:hypothetical protein AQI95_24580 [Streptomyces yokosukanensis]|uniref:Uncharacterized protein n=1 Tax=Streptomyces yokosukanensis TaxID=67386 RepID=A0A101P1D8_9ACTN|nr:hypothetical protein [Streptomyces yokosukanensis]KUN03139.1 hypothetical protein AQI95_24580 [Streptomyces yokosukanensis]
MAEAYPTPLAGQRLTASLLRSMQVQCLRKTSDTSRSATTTQAADPHLQMDVVAGGVYTVWGWLKYDALAAADITIGFSYPTGGLGEWVGAGAGTTVTSATGGGGTQQDAVSTWGYNVRLESTDVTATRTYGGLGVGNTLTIAMNATFRIGSNAGTLALTWAQASSSATATTVYTDSWLNVLRVA